MGLGHFAKHQNFVLGSVIWVSKISNSKGGLVSHHYNEPNGQHDEAVVGCIGPGPCCRQHVAEAILDVL